MAYTTAAEDAKVIRETLKKVHGWTSRQVSVRAEEFSMGSSISVTIKAAAVPLATVKAIAENAERIDRCSITGEILGGANRYVHVRYSSEVENIFGRRYADAVQTALDMLPVPADNTLQRVDGVPYLVGVDRDGRTITLWDASEDHAGQLGRFWTVDDAARAIGRREVK